MKMQSTIRELRGFLGRTLSHPRYWVVFAGMIVLFTLVGPFGTFDKLSLPMRLLYWTTTMTGTWLITMITVGLTKVLLPKNIPAAVMMLTGSSIAAFPNAAYLDIVIHWFLQLPPDLGFWYQFIYALPISIVFGMIVLFALASEFKEAESEPGLAAENPLIARLPHAKRGPVMHLSMQDHYVQVTTTHGSELVLMRMADAVHAMDGQNGLQIHRSHWIARDHVADTRREKGQPIVVMKDDSEFPVSRSFTKAAKEAGVI